MVTLQVQLQPPPEKKKWHSENFSLTPDGRHPPLTEETAESTVLSVTSCPKLEARSLQEEL